MPNEEMMTMAGLEKATGFHRDFINHRLRRYGVKPAGWVGSWRYWTRDQLPEIRRILSSNPTGDHGQAAGGDV